MISDCGFRIVDFGFRISDFGSWMLEYTILKSIDNQWNPKSEIHIPKSEIHIPKLFALAIKL
jgi:hypothetical protein